MRDIIKLALRLFIFSLVAAVALAVTNEITKGPIAEQKIAAQKEALSKVLPGYEYAEVENIEGLDEGSMVDRLFTATDAATGEIKGYALVANPTGYGGPIPITLGVSAEGYVTQTYVGALSETAGVGTRVAEADFMNQFIAIPADPDTLSDYVDTLSGATVSSSAFIGGVSDMLSYTKNTLGITPNAGDKEAILASAGASEEEFGEEMVETASAANAYDVTGFGPMKVEVSVDDAGKIISVQVVEHNETPGFGADLIANTAVFDALVGQDIATAQIDVKSGVTLTSNAINDALKQAAGTPDSASESAAVGDPYTVKGFGKFTLYIESSDGKIISIMAPEHNETPGFGADLLTEDALGALVGQNLATAQIDVKSGATLTSNAINNALKHAAAANGIAVEHAAGADEKTDAETAATVDASSSATGAAESEAPIAEVNAVTYEINFKGFSKHPFVLDVSVDAQGMIVAASCPENSETEGYGADLLTDEALSTLIGQSIADAQIDIATGATVTSNAINNALAIIAKEVQ